MRREFTIENGRGKTLGRRRCFPRNKPFAIVGHVINFDLKTGSLLENFVSRN